MFEFVLPAQATFVPLARMAVTRIAALYGLSPAQTDAVRLALTEAVSNVVRHAYPPGRPGPLLVRAYVEKGRLVIEVIDHGSPEQRERAAGRTDGLGFGLGLALIRELADDMSVRETTGGGWAVRLEFAGAQPVAD